MGGIAARRGDPALLGRERQGKAQGPGAGETCLSSGDAAERMVTTPSDWVVSRDQEGQRQVGQGGGQGAQRKGPHVLPGMDPVWVTGDLLGRRGLSAWAGWDHLGWRGPGCRRGRACVSTWWTRRRGESQSGSLPPGLGPSEWMWLGTKGSCLASRALCFQTCPPFDGGETGPLASSQPWFPRWPLDRLLGPTHWRELM